MIRVLVASLVVAGWGWSVGRCASDPPVTRQPAVAGSFYPADSAALRQLVERQLEAVRPGTEVDGDLIALVVPHAGLAYSGQVAAYSYQLLIHRNVKKVILCGPSHRVAFGGLSVYGPGVIWKTPLGEVHCDDALCKHIAAEGTQVTTDSSPHLQEHSLEVQLPYLQVVLKDFKIVPVLMGYQDAQAVDALAGILKKLPIDSAMIMIACTDWQHYRPASEGRRLDSIGVSYLERLDVDGLASCFDAGRSEACGAGPMVAMVKAAVARGANRVRILKVGDSGDANGDKSSVVGYVAAALYRSHGGTAGSAKAAAPAEKPAPNKPSPPSLSDADQRTLLEVARQSIDAHLRGQTPPKFVVSEALKKNGAAFVTLTEHGQLRGCIGTIEAREPLYLAVSHCAVSAATGDPRFEPVVSSEFPQLVLEISVLTPMAKVADLAEIEVGRDGLMIRMSGNSGLLLPQVATEYGWDRTTFLEQTCIKAGLPYNAYLRPEATIYRFQAQVFGEAKAARPTR